MKFLKKLPKKLILLATLLLAGYSIFTLIPEINKVIESKDIDYPSPGMQFEDLKSKLSKVTRAGFLTDKDTSSEKNDGEFLMAQYALAPIALDLNNAQAVNVISATSKEALIKILQDNKLKPIYINKQGKTIALKIQ